VRLDRLDGGAQFASDATRQGQHRRAASGVAAMQVPPVPLAAGRAALAAMHAADPLAAHRRLPAGPMVMLAPRLAARRQAQVAAPGVAAIVPWRQHSPTGHGVNPGPGATPTPRASRRDPQSDEVERDWTQGVEAGFSKY
jgi:hypothetical protein